MRQVVLDLNGKLIADEIVGHRFTFKAGRIAQMEVCEFPEAIRTAK
ncbi:MAG: hypothetical protein ACFB20_05155 [Opitutales bacterium]